MKASPQNFHALTSKLQEMADSLKNCHDPEQRMALLRKFKRLLDQADKLNESLLWKSD
jgi:hypothetical protein